MVYILRILNGDIQGVLSDALSGKTSLGWTESFMKKGIAIYLLYIYDEQMISPGMEVMLNMSKEAFEFTIKEYMRGQHGETNRDEKELFYDCFLKWKNTVSITLLNAGFYKYSISWVRAHVHQTSLKNLLGIGKLP